MLLTWSTPIATLGLLLVTIAYSYFTYQLVQVSRRQRFETIRPRIQVAVVATQRGGFFVLRIENVGISAALNFSVALDRDVHRQYGDRERINDMPIFKKGLPAFFSHTPVNVGLGVSHTYLAPNVDRSKHPARFMVTAKYDFEEHSYEENFEIEVHDLYAETMITHTEMSDLIKALKDEIGRPLDEATRVLKARLPHSAGT